MKGTWERTARPFFENNVRRKYYTEHKILYEWIDQLKPETILQVGIGFGREIKPLMPNPNIKLIVGIDISEQMLNFAKEWLGDLANTPKLRLVQGNICDDLPFSDDNFDLAFTLACLTHVPRRCIDSALAELLRVGKKVINIEVFGTHPQENLLLGGGNLPSFSYNYPVKYSKLSAKIKKVHRTADSGSTEYFCIQVSKNIKGV